MMMQATDVAARGTLGRVLVVDDDVDMVELLRSNLEAEGFRSEVCGSLDKMKQKVRQFSFDAVLLDLCLGEERGVEALPFLAREAPFAVVIVITAFGSIEVAVEAMGLGATSFIAKSGDPGRITAELKAKLIARRPAVVGASASAAPVLRPGVAGGDLGLVGGSPAMTAVRHAIEQMRDVDRAVIITGEPGTGKELVSRAIHRLSGRAGGKFESLNCAAIPEARLAAELCGDRDRHALTAGADVTLFLDEVSEMPLTVQAQLAGALAAQGSEAPAARLIAASSRDLGEEVARGRFREDLLRRLDVLSVHLPPLRERTEDIPALVDHFVAKFNERYGRAARPASHEVMARLMSYSWPGNIRELENAIERAVVMSGGDNGGDELRLDEVLKNKGPRRPDSGRGADPAYTTLSYADAKESFERAFLLRILTAAKGSIAEAARLSGRYRSDIYRLMERYEISPDAFKE